MTANRAEGDVDRLVFSRFFAKATGGLFVDVGAARPDYISVSRLFREKGWRVICVEPNPEFAALHRALGSEVYECACGAEDRDSADFFVVDSRGTTYEKGQLSYEAYSSLGITEGYAKTIQGSLDLRQIKVRVRKLDTILAEAGVEKIDVLSIDVEGWELEVLRGLDVRRHQPSVLIVENFLGNPLYEEVISRLGYTLWRDLPPNQVFVAPEVLERRSPYARLVDSPWVQRAKDTGRRLVREARSTAARCYRWRA